MSRVPHETIPGPFLSRSFQVGLLFHHPWAMAITGHRYDTDKKQWVQGLFCERVLPAPPRPMPYWTHEMIDAVCQGCHTGYPISMHGFSPHETGQTGVDTILWWVGSTGGLRVHLCNKTRDRELLRLYITPEDKVQVVTMTPEFGMVAKGAEPGTPIEEEDLLLVLAFIKLLGIPTEGVDWNIRREHAVTPKA